MSELEDAQRAEEAIAWLEAERAERQLQELMNETGPDCE